MVMFDIGKRSISFGLSSLATNVSNVIHFQNYSLWVTFEYIFSNLSFPLYCIKDKNFDRQKRIKKDLKHSINAIQFYQFSRGNNVPSNQVIAKIKLGFLEQINIKCLACSKKQVLSVKEQYYYENQINKKVFLIQSRIKENLQKVYPFIF